jgi:hypothetical protein
MIELDAVLSNADWSKRTPDTLDYMKRVAEKKAVQDDGKDSDSPAPEPNKRSRKGKKS